eukprot:361171_1
MFATFITLSIINTIQSGSISYDSPINVKSGNITDTIASCNIQYHDIYAWFDGSSFDVNKMKWMDYSSFQNNININSSNIFGKIKRGLFKDNLYIYGSTYDYIKMPVSLNLNKTNYTIITIARYNGNDRNTIFT